MNNLVYKTSLAVVPRLYVTLTRLWFGTCPVQIRGKENLDKVMDQGAAVVPFWHYSVFYMLYHLRQYPGVAMVSASKDGEYIARVAELLGFETVRGSANRFGVRALKGMVNHVKQGKNAGIVADGSQGPALKMQPGAIMLAAKSGSPIMPIVWATKRYKVFNSWDHSVVPMPLSPIILQYGDLIYVEPKLTSQRVEEYRQQVETAMIHMYQQLWQDVGKQGHV
ncbi:lysophospholipid acyltransferase family protein [Candidatus Electrothrix sp.]|uniref:lysophospholipid acyltransferase family protein n=1 Tax=Candidatus Electrothrix sp. TaxID=2170559 RepID=UPI004055DF80